jgi:CheY-like chemotaxis protein
MAKILLVEDDNNLREIYEARLQAEGYDIAAAHDGEEALVVAKEQNPDLIISDVMMPKISGFEMLDILRNTQGLKDVKVIMLTALGQSEDQQRADSLGADRYLVKSQVTLEDIVKVAQDLLQPAPAADAATTPTPAADTTAASSPYPAVPDPTSLPDPTIITPSAEPVAVTPEPAVAVKPTLVSEPVATTPEIAVESEAPVNVSLSAPTPEPVNATVVSQEPVGVEAPAPSAPVGQSTQTGEAVQPESVDNPTPEADSPEPVMSTSPLPEPSVVPVSPEPAVVVEPAPEPVVTLEPVATTPDATPTPEKPAEQPLATPPVEETPAEPAVAVEQPEPANEGITPAAAEATADAIPTQSTVEEAYSVESQIEDFIAKNSEPTPPANVPTATSTPSDSTELAATPTPEKPAEQPLATPPVEETPAEPAVAVEPPEADVPEAPQTPNDQLMSNAVDTLVANTQEPAVATPLATPSAVEPTEAPAPANSEPSVTPVGDPSSDTPDSSAIAGKKVIQPINSEPQPDLNTLLAREQAKEIAEQAVATKQAVIPDQPAAAVVTPDQPPQTPPFDPNSIAL